MNNKFRKRCETMTREEIERMEAGREMDALIAEKVMGWERRRMSGVAGHWWTYVTSDGKEGRSADVWMPSEDIGAAWQVVEKMTPVKMKDFAIRVCAEKAFEISWLIDDGDNWDFIMAETAPLAICRAALLAVMEES